MIHASSTIQGYCYIDARVIADGYEKHAEAGCSRHIGRIVTEYR